MGDLPTRNNDANKHGIKPKTTPKTPNTPKTKRENPTRQREKPQQQKLTQPYTKIEKKTRGSIARIKLF